MDKHPTKYSPPLGLEHIRRNYPHLLKDPAHLYRAESGIELLHEEPTLEEFDRISANWNLMSDKQKEGSDRKSIELYGMRNMERRDAIRQAILDKVNPVIKQAQQSTDPDAASGRFGSKLKSWLPSNKNSKKYSLEKFQKQTYRPPAAHVLNPGMPTSFLSYLHTPKGQQPSIGTAQQLTTIYGNRYHNKVQEDRGINVSKHVTTPPYRDTMYGNTWLANDNYLEPYKQNQNQPIVYDFSRGPAVPYMDRSDRGSIDKSRLGYLEDPPGAVASGVVRPNTVSRAYTDNFPGIVNETYDNYQRGVVEGTSPPYMMDISRRFRPIPVTVSPETPMIYRSPYEPGIEAINVDRQTVKHDNGHLSLRYLKDLWDNKVPNPARNPVHNALVHANDGFNGYTRRNGDYGNPMGIRYALLHEGVHGQSDFKKMPEDGRDTQDRTGFYRKGTVVSGRMIPRSSYSVSQPIELARSATIGVNAIRDVTGIRNPDPATIHGVFQDLDDNPQLLDVMTKGMGEEASRLFHEYMYLKQVNPTMATKLREFVAKQGNRLYQSSKPVTPSTLRRQQYDPLRIHQVPGTNQGSYSYA